MASIKNQLEAAVYAALNVSSVTDIATGGVHSGAADESGSYPLVTFSFQGFEENLYTFGFGETQEGGLLLIKASSDEDSDVSKAPADLNDEILEACETILHGSISLSSATLDYLRKFADVPVFRETLSDRTVFTSGRMYKFKASL